jgi:pimeloyl-ACP methyl ester carboxylesterase
MNEEKSRRWMKRVALTFGVLALLGYATLQVGFRSWRTAEWDRIRSGSEIISLETGTMEYALTGEGPVVLWFHGASGGYDQAPSLGGFRVLAPSRPGYLRTELGVGETLSEAAAAYKALLDSLGIERVAVAGVSAGGPTTLEFSSRYPERVWAVVMISAISRERIRPVPERGRFSRATDLLIGEGFTDWLQARLLARFPQILVSDEESEYFSAEDREMLRSDPVKLRELVDRALPLLPMSKRRFPGFVNDRIQYGRMGEPDPLPITAPTLVIHGTADPDVGFEHAESTIRRIPHAVLLPVEGAGHLALVTQADLIWPRLLEFLGTHAK